MGWIEQVHSDLTVRMRDLRGLILSTTGNFVAGQDYITVPTGLTELISIRVDTDRARHLDLVSEHQFIDIATNGAGRNRVVAMTWGSQYQLRLAPTPNATDGYTLRYEGSLGEAVGNTTSQVLDENPNVLIYGACYFGSVFLRDEMGISLYSDMYAEARAQYQRHLGRVKMGGGKLARRPDNMPNDRHRSSI
jgi:hypothetical protein